MGTPREDHPDAVRRSRIAAAGEKCIIRLQRRIINALEDAETILTETQRDQCPVCGGLVSRFFKITLSGFSPYRNMPFEVSRVIETSCGPFRAFLASGDSFHHGSVFLPLIRVNL